MDDKGTGVCGTQVGAGQELRGIMLSVCPSEIRPATDSGPRAPHNVASVVDSDLPVSYPAGEHKRWPRLVDVNL